MSEWSKMETLRSKVRADDSAKHYLGSKEESINKGHKNKALDNAKERAVAKKMLKTSNCRDCGKTTKNCECN